MYGLNVKVHLDYSVSLLESDKETNYIFVNNNLVKDGKLIFKFREVGNFYCMDATKLTSDHNFPDKCEIVNIEGTGITELNLKHVGTYVKFDKLTKFRVESCDEDLLVDGDFSDLDTFAYLPISTGIMSCKPFLYYCDNNHEKLILEKDMFPRVQIFIEMLFIITKKHITGLKQTNKADPNHYYSRLLWMIKSGCTIAGIEDPWISHKDTIDWPEGFITDRVETCVDNLNRFNL